MVRTLAAQTHLHVLLIGPGQELLERYEFENTFSFGALLPVIESALTCPILDFEAAKFEFEQMFDLRSLFQTEQAESTAQQEDAANEDVGEAQDLSERGNALDWSEVEPAAKLAFSIWIGQPELIWAKKAFDVLVAARLVESTDVFSRHIAFFRVLVLGGIYRDFCQAAWEETSWVNYDEWCEPEEIVDRFIVGQLFARMPDWQADEDDEYSVALVAPPICMPRSGRAGRSSKIRRNWKKNSTRTTVLNQMNTAS
jgi:hypothetical protein